MTKINERKTSKHHPSCTTQIRGSETLLHTRIHWGGGGLLKTPYSTLNPRSIKPEALELIIRILESSLGLAMCKAENQWAGLRDRNALSVLPSFACCPRACSRHATHSLQRSDQDHGRCVRPQLRRRSVSSPCMCGLGPHGTEEGPLTFCTLDTPPLRSHSLLGSCTLP